MKKSTVASSAESLAASTPSTSSSQNSVGFTAHFTRANNDLTSLYESLDKESNRGKLVKMIIEKLDKKRDIEENEVPLESTMQFPELAFNGKSINVKEILYTFDILREICYTDRDVLAVKCRWRSRSEGKSITTYIVNGHIYPIKRII